MPFILPRITRLATVLVALCAGAGVAQAQDDFFAGARALGMGGANTACVDDYTAQYYNPAAFGFFADRDQDGGRYPSDNNDIGAKRWGFGLDASAGEVIQGNMSTYIDLLSTVPYDDLGSQGAVTAQNVENLVKVAQGLQGIGNPQNGITANATAGVGMRIGHFGLGFRSYFEATARVYSLDLGNVGVGSGNLNTQLANSGVTGDGHISLFTPAQQQQLAAAGLDARSIGILDYTGRQEGVNSSTAAGFASVLASIAQATDGGGGNLSNNDTAALVTAFGLAELPLSYGYAIDSHFSVGASLKCMVGRVYDTTVQLFSSDTEQVLRSANNNYRQSVNLGVDVGAMARMRYLQVGLSFRNLNDPEFAGPTVNGITFPDVHVAPQGTLGVAFMPFTSVVVESDIDLLKAETTLQDYDTQRLSGGVEWTIFHFLALRGGCYRHLAESSAQTVVTAGFGFDVGGVKLDLAGSRSINEGDFNGHSYPLEANVAMSLLADF